MKYINSLLVIFMLLIYAMPSYSQHITLITWNLKDLGNSKNAVEIRFIAQTIRNADIVAIQEVVAGDGGAQAVARLAAELNTMGAAWDYAVSNPTSSSAYKTERYAYVWKKSRVKLQGKPWLDVKYNKELDREPYLATFNVEGKSFTIVNFHAITASKHPETELMYLAYLQAEYPVLNLIIAGDFNLPQSHTVFNPLKNMGYRPALTNQKTSLRQHSLPDGCLASEYDNIFYKPEYLQLIDKGIIHFYEKVDTFEKARLISDHVPVYLKFNLK